jgi:peptidoglycan hydrolase-like protein with peptidoglycan-binding domain
VFKRISQITLAGALLVVPVGVIAPATAATAATPIRDCVDVTNQDIGRGSTGSYVQEVQCLLNYAINPSTYHLLTVDGDFGPDTESKVIKFQQCANMYDSAGLDVDGRVGPHTAPYLQKWASSARYLC